MKRYVITSLIGLLFLSTAAAALIVGPDISDTPANDALHMGPGQVHELGDGAVFPANEIIGPDSADNGDHWLVSIINFTQTDWTNLIYVADPETSIDDPDGLVNGCPAFHIDATGVNTPLISESDVADGVFAPNEEWIFKIMGYSNSQGLDAHRFLSLDVGDISAGDSVSSGSIIAVPEPATLGVLLMGGLVLLRGKRRFEG